MLMFKKKLLSSAISAYITYGFNEPILDFHCRLNSEFLNLPDEVITVDQLREWAGQIS